MNRKRDGNEKGGVTVKKTIGWIAALAMISMCLPPAVFAVDNYTDGALYDKVVFTDDFEGYIGGTIPAVPWARTNKSATTLTAIDAEGEGLADGAAHGLAAKLAKAKSAAGEDSYMRIQYSGNASTGFSGPIAGNYTAHELQCLEVKLDILVPEELRQNLNLRFLDTISGASTKAANFTVVNAAPVQTLSFTGGKAVPYQPNQWYSLVYYFDFTQDVYSAYVNGELVAENQSTGAVDSCLTSIGVQVATTTSAWAICLDNVTITSIAPAQLSLQTPQQDFDDFPMRDGTVFFASSKPLEADTIPTPVLDDESGEPVLLETEVTGSGVQVILPDMLAFDRRYTVTLPAGARDIYGFETPELEVEFTTMQQDVISARPVLTVGSADAQGTVVVDNPFGEPKTAALALTACNEAGEPLAFSAADARLEAQQQAVVSAALDLPADTAYVQAFPIESIQSARPLRSDIVQSSDELPVVDSGAGDVVLQRAEITDNQLMASGSVLLPGRKAVVIQVVAPDSSIQMMQQVYSDRNGKFTFTYTMPENAPLGSYAVRAYVREAGKMSEKSVSYLLEEELIAAVNGAAEPKELADILRPYHAFSQLDDAYFCDNGYLLLFEQRPYTTFTEIVQTLQTAQTLLATLNTTAPADMSAWIVQQADLLFADLTDIDAFRALKADQGLVIRYLEHIGKYTDIAMFREDFARAMEQYANRQEEKPIKPSKPSGGQGSGGGAGYVPGGYGTGSSTATDPATNPEQEIQPNKPYFSDLEGYDWAKAAIDALAQQDIVTGDGSGIFRPADMITRAEFIKMMVLTMQIQPISGAVVFSDVLPDDWYAPYAAAAQRAGLIYGDEQGHFNGGRSITREEMAVIVYRAMGETHIIGEVTDEAQRFTDDSDIQPYSRNAVYAMRQLGLIAGMDGNRFAPAQAAQRAQAAQILYNFLVMEGDGR